MDPIAGNVFAAECILKERRKKGKKEYLIKWKGWNSKWNSWEPSDNILDDRLFDEFNSKKKGVVNRKRGHQTKNEPSSGPKKLQKTTNSQKKGRKVIDKDDSEEEEEEDDEESDSDSDVPIPTSVKDIVPKTKHSTTDSNAQLTTNVRNNNNSINTSRISTNESNSMASTSKSKDDCSLLSKLSSESSIKSPETIKPTVAPLVIKLSNNLNTPEQKAVDENESSSSDDGDSSDSDSSDSSDATDDEPLASLARTAIPMASKPIVKKVACSQEDLLQTGGFSNCTLTDVNVRDTTVTFLEL